MVATGKSVSCCSYTVPEGKLDRNFVDDFLEFVLCRVIFV